MTTPTPQSETPERVPICGLSSLTVSRAIWDEAWMAYAKQYGDSSGQHARLLKEGFYTGELDMFRPGWRPVEQRIAALERQLREALETIRIVSTNIASSPANIQSESELVGRALLELDKLQQEKFELRAEAAERRAPPSETPLTDAADDPTMRFSGRHRRLRDLCSSLERRLREALAENKRILELHKGLMTEADKRLEAAERRVERKGMVMVPKELLDFVKNQKDLPADFRKVLNDNYWDLLSATPNRVGGMLMQRDIWNSGDGESSDCPIHGKITGDKICPLC